jgi:acyl-CoA thioesterase II
MALTLDSLLGSFTLEPTGDGHYRAPNAESGHAVIFGGQLMGQSIVAGLLGHEGKRVKTLHIVFARAGNPDAPVEITVDPMHSGRAFASSTVTISQGDRLITRASVLLSADEPDFISHADVSPSLKPPDDDAGAAGTAAGTDAWEIRIVDDVDISDPALTGPPELDVWTRFRDAPADAATDQALLSFATDAFLIATAMRPHEGVGQAQAHRTLSTGVISHTITFHEPCAAAEWMLLSHHSTYAGHGRCYGRANVFRADGVLAASYVQDAMIKPLEPRGGSGPTL